MLRRIIERSRPARAWTVAALMLGTVASGARAQSGTPGQDPPARETVPITGAPISDVRDTAGLFSPDAVAKAEVETILSRAKTGGKLPPAAATGRNAPEEDGSAP